jgi:hypothetical protein
MRLEKRACLRSVTSIRRRVYELRASAYAASRSPRISQITAVCDPVFLDIRAVRPGLAAVVHVFEKSPPARRRVEPVPLSLERFCRLPSGNLPRAEVPASVCWGREKWDPAILRFRGELDFSPVQQSRPWHDGAIRAPRPRTNKGPINVAAP